MFDSYLYLALFAVALAMFALGYGARAWSDRMREQERQLTALQATVADLERRANPASRHDWKDLERQDIGEATLFDLAHMREQVETLTTWLEYASGRAAHVAPGGQPNDPPTKWAK